MKKFIYEKGKKMKIKMKRLITICAILGLILAVSGVTQADVFGTGTNQFTIDFVPISGSTNPSSGISQGGGSFIFTGVNNDYRMGTCEITNDQWDKFKNAYGTVTGNPLNAYDDAPIGALTWPTNNVSWYEMAQFVNWLNTSTGHHAAYNFTGTQGTSNYTFALWSAAEADNGTNLYRHKDAKYYVPTEDEWVKAAYWNATSLTCQLYANASPSDLISGVPDPTKWNYRDTPISPHQPWNVGSGRQELNGTFDMMGNLYEVTESQYNNTGGYSWTAYHGVRSASYAAWSYELKSIIRTTLSPYDESSNIGFRVASDMNTVVINPADLTGDGMVNYLDLAILVDQWLQPPGSPSADLNSDGIVNFVDFATFAENWLGGI
ncbi:MAG: SUMF1/EgtB/PvdO family nonheme iron enzyme [Phycisphaerae bacterium]